MNHIDVDKKIEPAKIFGTYPQKQEGLFMQRIPLNAGRITAGNLRDIASIAIEFTDRTPLHLTTRQGIEFHNIAESDAGPLLQKLKAVGLSTFGACGDTVRNFTVCPCCKFNAEAFDVEPLAEQVRVAFADCDFLEKMGRKFKITFSGCDNSQVRPYVMDVSFIATGATTVRVVGAGSLGAKPNSGIVLAEEISVSDVVAFSFAAAAMFAEHGDRTNRRKARSRHIRERLSNEAFLKLLGEYFDVWKGELGKNEIVLGKGLPGWKKVATLQTVAGNIDTKDALQLADMVEEAGAEIRINAYHGIDVFSKDDFTLPGQFDKYLALPKIVACPGSTTCPKGIVDCPAVAKLIADELKNNPKFHNKTIAMSSCPNNCAGSAIADIGLIGRVKNVDGIKKQAFNVTFNNENGNNDQLGIAQDIVTSDEVAKWITNNYK